LWFTAQLKANRELSWSGLLAETAARALLDLAERGRYTLASSGGTINRTAEHRTIRFGAFEVDLRAGELRKNGTKVKVQEKPFQILALLLEHQGEVVTRAELRQKLWSADTFVDFDHSLGTAIGKLRQALGDSAQNPSFVETLGSRGYRFIPPAAGSKQALAIPDESGIATGEGSSVPVAGAVSQKSAWSPLKAWVTVAGAVVITLAAILIAMNVGGWRDTILGRGRTAEISSLAVLPLENLSRDPDREYFAEGMTDELITNLGKIGALRVISRTSVMPYKGTRKPLAQIARELNVDAVVEGTVLQSAERVRITAQLIRVNPENHLWAESYERDLRDVLRLQEEVARDIAEEVGTKLVPQHSKHPTEQQAVSPEVHAACLKGLYHANRYTEEEIQRGIGYFNQAVQKNPSYAPAYAGLARSYTLLST
jgi:TolB-like protein/DNA-binding winged helix-turn-helix (wHTH) protein